MAKKDFDFDLDFGDEFDDALNFDTDGLSDSDFTGDIDFSEFTQGSTDSDSLSSESDGLDLDGIDFGDESAGNPEDFDVLGGYDDLGDLDLDGIDLSADWFSAADGGEDADVPVDDTTDWSGTPDAEDDFSPSSDVSEEAEYFDDSTPDGEPTDSEPEETLSQEAPAQNPDDDFDDTDFDEEDFKNTIFGGPVRRRSPAPQPEPAAYESENRDETSQPVSEAPARHTERKQRKEKAPKAPKPPREQTPNLFTKLIALYFPGKQEEPPVDPNNPRRRRRKRSKAQIFKEVYLPPILAGLTLFMVLVIVIGSISTSIQRRQKDNQLAQQESQSASEEADRLEKEGENLLNQAEKLAKSYDYQAAVDLLGTYSGDSTSQAAQQINVKKSEYLAAQSSLVEYKNYSDIANLSFHMLINDMAQALKDTTYGGMYNRNFVTTGEFEQILGQLYAGGYVLVDFDSFIGSSVGLDGKQTYYTVPITLPEGKKPIMLTQTQVNYYQFMIDSNKDGTLDHTGFASRLVLDEQGNVKAEYVDASGATQVGNYDFVPILEDFIEKHPDFSYKGARATLAVSGSEGIFGYRINTTYISTVSQTYYDEQVAGAKALVEALRSKGYRLACYTYEDIPYGEKSANQIGADLQEWNKHIAPVIGTVDTLIYAKTSDIGNYTGPKFTVLYDAGFRYFLKHGSAPSAEVNNTYVCQTRLMVTGNSLAWQSSMFNSYFDAGAILDPARGNVPN